MHKNCVCNSVRITMGALWHINICFRFFLFINYLLFEMNNKELNRYKSCYWNISYRKISIVYTHNRTYSKHVILVINEWQYKSLKYVEIRYQFNVVQLDQFINESDWIRYVFKGRLAFGYLNIHYSNTKNINTINDDTNPWIGTWVLANPALIVSGRSGLLIKC